MIKRKKKDLALKVSNASNDCDNDENEEIAFLLRKFIRFLTRKKECALEVSKSDINDGLICYKCKKLISGSSDT